VWFGALALAVVPAGRSVGPTPPSELNIVAVLSERRVEPGAGGRGRLGSQEG
jgi:hypothetical protein